VILTHNKQFFEQVDVSNLSCLSVEMSKFILPILEKSFSFWWVLHTQLSFFNYHFHQQV
jgi:hypothetical protein